MKNKISKQQVKLELLLSDNRDVVWLTGVVAGCRNAAKRLKGLHALVKRGVEVSTVSFQTYLYRTDDGVVHSFSELEQVPPFGTLEGE